MISFFEKLPEKYQVEEIKYPFGKFNYIYIIEPRKKVARILINQTDLNFSTQMCFHTRDLSKKLGEKGYPVAKVEGVYKIFQKNWNIFQPGTVMEDKSDFVMLRNVPEMFYNYFKDYYHEILTNSEKEGFVVGDTNEGNFLCNLKTREGCLIDFDDWEYLGKGKKILSPKYSYLSEN